MTIGEVITGLGFVVGAAVFWWMCRRRRMETDGLALIAVSALAFAVFGAKIAQLLAEGWPIRAPWWVLFDPRAGGKALLGGILGGWLGTELAKRRLGIRRSTGDLFALALPAGEAVGRVGCFFNQCCYGSVCRLPWSVYQHGEWRHPAQLYSSFVSVLIFLAVLRLEFRPAAFIRREGDLFRVYLLLFGFARFGLEFVRWRESLIWGLSPMQWFCLDLIVAATIGLIRSQRLPAKLAS